jgi:hypothetical protein
MPLRTVNYPKYKIVETRDEQDVIWYSCFKLHETKRLFGGIARNYYRMPLYEYASNKQTGMAHIPEGGALFATFMTQTEAESYIKLVALNSVQGGQNSQPRTLYYDVNGERVSANFT